MRSILYCADLRIVGIDFCTSKSAVPPPAVLTYGLVSWRRAVHCVCIRNKFIRQSRNSCRHEDHDEAGWPAGRGHFMPRGSVIVEASRRRLPQSSLSRRRRRRRFIFSCIFRSAAYIVYTVPVIIRLFTDARVLSRSAYSFATAFATTHWNVVLVLFTGAIVAFCPSLTKICRRPPPPIPPLFHP